MTDISDHYPIFHIANYVQAQDVEYTITRRNYTTKNKDSFCHNCQTLIWKMFYSRITHREPSLCSTINLENYMIVASLCNIYLKSITLGGLGCPIHYVMLSKNKQTLSEKYKNKVSE